MAWHLAKSLDTFRSQVNAKWPGRDKSSDGTIGDTAHSARKSGHNPDIDGAVKAIDITHDPDRGLNCTELAEVIKNSKDPRIDYIIWNRKISNPVIQAGAWRAYNGSNPHTMHMHLQVLKKGCESAEQWEAVGSTSVSEIPSGVPAPKMPLLKFGMSGLSVKVLQVFLKVPVTGTFDRSVENAVKALQTKNALISDGIVGPYTWDSMVGKPASP